MLYGKKTQACHKKCHWHSNAFVRMDAVNEEILNEYFDLLEGTLNRIIPNCPFCIYNVD